jgi:glycosyltransferase involved in cell wall biosynthesis
VRILVATDQWFPNYKGGAARFAADHAACLAGAGHEVHVLAPRGADLPPGLHAARSIPKTFLPRTLVDPIGTFVAARRERARAFDVVVAHQVTTGYGSLRALPRTPLVFVFHASAAREARLRGAGLKDAALARLLARLERSVVGAAAAIIPLSAYSRGLLEADHAEAAGKIVTLSGAVDTSFFRPADPDRLESTPTLLIVRRLEEGVGIEQALRAIALLAGDGPLEVAFAGAGPAAGRMQALAAQLGLAGTVTFLGSVTSEQLLEQYRRAHAVLIPPAPHEGFGLAAVEALACARPAVGTGGALTSVLGGLDASLLATDSSPAALADAVRRALTLSRDAEFRTRCRTYAVENFGWQRAGARWDELLHRIAGGDA